MTTLAEGEGIHAWPQVLPGGHGSCSTRAASVTERLQRRQYRRAADCPAVRAKVIQRGGYHGRLRAERPSSSTSMTGRCSPCRSIVDRLEPTGSAVARCSTASVSNGITGGAQFSVSDTGTACLSCRAQPRRRRAARLS